VVCTWISTCGHTPAWRQRRKRMYTVGQGLNQSAGKSHYNPTAGPSAHGLDKQTRIAGGCARRMRLPRCPDKRGKIRSHCASVIIPRSLFVLKG
jgi:hypothetical protein